MKFDSSSPVDAQHCLAIKHEYLRCRDAFTLFQEAATGIVLSGHSREAAYRAYNAYSSFILHLYEFLIALHARDYGDTEVVSRYAAQKANLKREDILDALVDEDAVRVVQARIDRIKRGAAPSYENDLSYYTRLLPLPADFAKTLRQTRNKIGAHVTYERIGEIDLTAFYLAHHPYLYLLFRDVGDYWGRHCEDIPDLDQVTNFFKALVASQSGEGGAGGKAL
ncbi:MAG: hypothetical protein ACKVIS_02500 [Pseudomonadales bacterium]